MKVEFTAKFFSAPHEIREGDLWDTHIEQFLKNNYTALADAS